MIDEEKLRAYEDWGNDMLRSSAGREAGWLVELVAEVRRLREELEASAPVNHVRAEAISQARRAERERCVKAITDRRVASMQVWTEADSDAIDAIRALPYD